MKKTELDLFIDKHFVEADEFAKKCGILKMCTVSDGGKHHLGKTVIRLREDGMWFLGKIIYLGFAEILINEFKLKEKI
jgi:hypothetical protein